MNGLSPDVLEHSLAFKGQSAQLFNDVIRQVRCLTQDQGSIYPPTQFPNPPNRVPESTLRRVPESDLNGYLFPAEAVAVTVLLTECSALAQAWGRSFETSNKLHAVLQLPPEGLDNDAIAGIAEFGDTLAAASAVREWLANGDGEPTGTTINDKFKRGLWRRYSGAIGQDNLGLGSTTSEAIVRTIAEFARRDIPHNPEGARTPEDVGAKIESRIHGARLAQELYLEALALASTVLSSFDDPKEER